MNTQLLEDIGLSAPLSLVPSGRAPSKVGEGVMPLAQAADERRAKPRTASGVWRQKPAASPAAISLEQPPDESAVMLTDQLAGESASIITQQPESAAIITQELDELLSALEAPQPPEQTGAVEPHVPPEPPHDEAQVPPEPAHVEAAASYGPTFSWDPVPGEQAPRDPLFDFTPPSPTAPTPDLFRREPTWFERSGRRVALWGSCVVAGALIIQGGLWLSQERKDADPLAFVIDESKAEPQLDNAVRKRAIAAKEFTLASNGDVQVTPATPKAPEPTAKVPPLVLLAPDPAEASKAAEAAAPDQGAAQVTDKPDQVAERVQTPPRVRNVEREQASATRAARTQVRPAARETAPPREIKTASGSLSAETLKACQEHGYQAAQCVKRTCSMTKYGFVCRG